MGAVGSFLVHLTWSLNFKQSFSVYLSPYSSSPSFGYLTWFSKSLGSALIGIKPILWARFSSGMIDVFYHIFTFSMAIVGISAINILLKAFARGGSTPTKSKMISSSSSFITSMSQFLINSLRLVFSNSLVVPVKEAGCS